MLYIVDRAGTGRLTKRGNYLSKYVLDLGTLTTELTDVGQLTIVLYIYIYIYWFESGSFR